jgi:hypothetical protein
MKSLKNELEKYFYSVTDKWCSIISGNLHEITYNGRKCSFDGYRLIDVGSGKLIEHLYGQREFYENVKFKLLSIVVLPSGDKNYLGESVDSKVLITFSEEQITFRNNEKSI